jgi:hypothetical protein
MGGQGMSMFIWSAIVQTVMRGSGLDLEITRGVPSSVSVCVACAEANRTRSNDRFLSLISDL